MKNRLRVLALMIPFLLTFSGCGGQPPEETLRPLDDSAWQAPPTPTAIPSPTPFPKITLADLTAASAAVVTDPPHQSEAIAVSHQEEVETSDPAPAPTLAAPAAGVPVEAAGPALPEAAGQSSSILADLKPVARASVKSTGLNVRQGPSPDYELLGVLEQGEEVAILAFNSKQDWALIQSARPGVGWVSLQYLDLAAGSLADVPVVLSARPGETFPAGQIAPIFGLDGQSRATTPTEPEMAPTAPGPDFVGGAVIATNPVYVRPAPGPEAAIGELANDDEKIAILGVDPNRQWALIYPEHSDSRPGWVLLDELKITAGNIAAAPTVYTAWTKSNALPLHQGSGIFHPVVGELPINNLVRVIGLNEGRSWALVQPLLGGGQGWTQIQYLALSEKVAGLPLAPAPAPAITPEPIDPAQAAGVTPAGRLVFQRHSGGEILIINADGTGLRPLTTGIDPVLSPDGQTVAFTRWEGEAGSLWLIGVDGSNERSIMGFTQKAKGPAWSPDGSQIVLNFQHGGRLEAEKICHDLSEGDPPPLPPNAYDYTNDGQPEVNVDIKGPGKFDLDFCWKIPPDPHWSLRMVNVADGSFEDLDGGTYAFRPDWDPRQPWRIISDGGRGLVEIDLNQNSARHMTEVVGDGSPVFSPDGRYIALVAGQPNNNQGTNIDRLNSDGSGRTRLTKTPLWVPVMPGEQKQWNNVSPAWSADSRQIAFLTDRTGRWEIWVMNADGSQQMPMFSAEINDQLGISYNFVDERVLSWR